MPDFESMTVKEILDKNQLRIVIQPIVSLRDGRILAHEALVRGPRASPLEFPDHLFRAADLEGLRPNLEVACVQAALVRLQQIQIEGRLFVNLSAQVLVTIGREWGIEKLIEWLGDGGTPLTKLTIELTEHDRIDDVDYLKSVSDALRAHGLSFALDDFGDGRSSLRLWAEIQPEYVKIDKFFTRDLSANPYKVQTLKALAIISETLGGSLIAEGIEDEYQLSVVRDQGIAIGQGYFIGRPAAEPLTALSKVVATAIASCEVPVCIDNSALIGRNVSAERLVKTAPALPSDKTNGEVFALLLKHPEYHALAVVKDDRPIGLINRRTFIDRFTQPYHQELYARQSCIMFMIDSPKCLEKTAGVAEMIALLTSEDQRYLSDGFIIVDNGRYVGLGTGEQLVRTVTEQRLEAARHANPLTFLPGNVPISVHIEKLLASGNEFGACYCDLNHFKPFNDQYGYWRGDEMIRLLASVLISECNNRVDFIGHVGGDDFILLFQSEDWIERCQKIIEIFNRRAITLFDDEAIALCGIAAEDREGNPAFFPLTTLSIGCIAVKSGDFRRAEDVASAAAAAKRQAKRMKLGFWVKSEAAETAEFVPAAQ